MKYDVRKLQEVVVEPMQRMEQENQQMQSLQEEHNTLKKTVSETSKILELRGEELQVLRERAEKQHAENKRQVILLPVFNRIADEGCRTPGTFCSVWEVLDSWEVAGIGRFSS